MNRHVQEKSIIELVRREERLEARKDAKESTGRKMHFLSNYLPIIVLGTMVVSIH